jgi:predicted transcriptional regulator with HTH domain
MPDKNADSPDIGRICRSLDNSSARRDVLDYLCLIYPVKASVDDISLATGYHKVDVIGAVNGYRLRYRKQDSLMDLGLASCTMSVLDGRPVQLFSAVQSALDIRERLKDYLFRSSSKTNAGLLRKLRDKVLKR